MALRRIASQLSRVATTVLLLSGAVVLLPREIANIKFLGIQPAIAQRVRPEGVWQQIYQRLPNLPQENQYVSVATGKADTENTLVGRLIRYHLYVKSRSPFFRLDWKLTLADYLGVNDAMEEMSYPSQAALKRNPLDGDIAAIKRLNRAQRDALIQALVEAFNPQTGRPSGPALTSPKSPKAATESPKPQPTPGAPRGSGADLLRP